MKAPRCRVCGRSLRSPSSVAKGIGPSCERKLFGVVKGITASRSHSHRDGDVECMGLLGDEDDD